MYLSSYQTVTVWHLRDIAAGKRLLIKAKDIKEMHIPLFEGLSSKNLLEFGMQYPKVRQALPLEEREIDKLLRKYVGNLIYTLVGEPFRVWVESVIQERNKKLCEDRNLNIEMDPEVYKVFMESTSVSSKCVISSVISVFYSRQGHEWILDEEERGTHKE